MSAALTFEGATVGYDAAVVSDVDLAVESGVVVGLIGPNGAGKTTLVRSVTGAASVLGGRVAVFGKDASAYSSRELARVVGVLPQTVPAAFAFSARRFVEMGRHAHVSRFGDLGPHDAAAVERAMELTDTGRLAYESVDTLSGGDLQRLTLAQALAQEPSVLLLDEPTSHLDLNHRLQVLDVMRVSAESGVAVLAVFHDLDMAARYSDVLAVVARGRVGPAERPERVLTSSMLAEVFGVRAVTGTDPVTGAVTITPVIRDSAPEPSRGVSVLVVSGSGSGAAVMRQLVLAGYRVSGGALSADDTDSEVAAALGVDVVHLAPFGAMSDVEEVAVAAAAEAADVIVVCSTPFGRGNLGNLRAVVAAGRPLVLIGEMDAGRDFTGGEATELWNRATSGRVVRCSDVSVVTACIEEANRR